MSLDLWNHPLAQKPTIQQKVFENIVVSGHLAPSSHNTQPWLFQIGEDYISLFLDMRQRLEIADPTNKEMHISCGCALANMEIAAHYYGFEPKISLFPDSTDSTLVAQIKLKKGKPNQALADLFPFIQKRKTNRSAYDPDTSISSETIQKAQDLIDDLPVELVYTQDKKDLSFLAEINKTGIHQALSNPQFREELSEWVRHNWTQKGDGLSGDTMGLPNAMSILLPLMVRSPQIAQMSSSDEEKMILSASFGGVIAASKDEPHQWLASGQAFERISLAFTRDGVNTAVLTAAIEMPEQKKQLAHWLGKNRIPQLFFRAGFATKDMPHSHRRELSEVIKT